MKETNKSLDHQSRLLLPPFPIPIPNKELGVSACSVPPALSLSLTLAFVLARCLLAVASTLSTPALLLLKLFLCTLGVIPANDPEVEFEGLELICSNNDAAVSSSGVQLGDTVGESETRFPAETTEVVESRREGIVIRMSCVRCSNADGVEDDEDVENDEAREGCAGPGRDNAGSVCVVWESGMRNVPDNGGVGRCDDGFMLGNEAPARSGEGNAEILDGSRYDAGSHDDIGGRQGDADDEDIGSMRGDADVKRRLGTGGGGKSRVDERGE